MYRLEINTYLAVGANISMQICIATCVLLKTQSGLRSDKDFFKNPFVFLNVLLFLSPYYMYAYSIQYIICE